MKKKHFSPQTVPVLLASGIIATIKPQSIPDAKWEHHHGKTAAGQRVNSLKTTRIDESLLLQNGAGGPTFSVPMADFEVAAVQLLGGLGYQVTSAAST